MKWLVSHSETKVSIKIPDRIIDGEEFAATIAGTHYIARWARSLGTLYLRTATGDSPEAAHRLRSVSLSRYPGESAADVSLEYVAATQFRAQALIAQVEYDVPAQAQRGKARVDGAAVVRSPMSGKVLQILVADGAIVKKGDVVVIVEAMKMENRIAAPQAGVIKKLALTAGAAVNTGDLLFEIGPAAGV